MQNWLLTLWRAPTILNRNSAAMVLLLANIPGSVSVPSGGGDEDDCTFMDVTVQSNAARSK
jgi:hypothetical protein